MTDIVSDISKFLFMLPHITVLHILERLGKNMQVSSSMMLFIFFQIDAVMVNVNLNFDISYERRLKNFRNFCSYVLTII